jgi:mono/diheme cytochrome c family protein
MKNAVARTLGILGLLVSLTLACFAQTPGGGKKAVDSVAKKSTGTDEGERRFRHNCGRCHNPPDSLSPREAKAVLQQMRVRAMLTAEDERLILKYLAP